MKTKNVTRTINSLLVFSLSVLVSTLAVGKDLPKTTHDGLDLIEDTKLRAVYMKPDASLDQYTRVAILDTYVAFEKDWQRDYNRQSVGMSSRISDTDMNEIKKRVGDEFNKTFQEELEKKGFSVVNTTGNDVLVLRPAIVNLDVNAPDTMKSFSRSYVSSAGSMTLYLELYDSVSNAIIARVIDPESAQHSYSGVPANRATNKQQEDIIVRKWADVLASHLGKVHPADG